MRENLLLHHLVNGILLDHLTIPVDPQSDPVATAEEAARCIAALDADKFRAEREVAAIYIPYEPRRNVS